MAGSPDLVGGGSGCWRGGRRVAYGEQKQKRNVNAFGGQSVGVAAAIALQKAMALQLSQVVAELVESVCFRGQLKRSENCLVNLFGRPAADGAAVVQKNLQQPDDPGVMDFDAGITNRADGDGQGNLLQQGKST